MRYSTIEFGCGDVCDLRFDYRSDIQETSASNILADIRDLSKFDESMFAYAKLAAVLEHITPVEQVMAMIELHRVMVPHGVIWITTPDLQWMRDARDSGAITSEWYETLLRGGERDEYDIHKGLLTADTMDSLVSETGFKIIWARNGHQSGGSLDYTIEAIK